MPTVPRRLLSVLFAGLCLWPATAQAAQRRSSSTWSTPQTVAAVGKFDGAVTKVAANGSSLTMWLQHGIRVRSRSATGQLQPEQIISAPQSHQALNSAFLAMAPNGTAVIVWTVLPSISATRTVSARFRFPDGTLSPIQDLTDQLAADRARLVFFGPHDGLPRLVWPQSPEPDHPRPQGLFVAALDPANGLGAPTQLDDPATAVDGFNATYAVASDANGRSLMVWVTQNPDQVRGRVMAPDGSLGPLLTISRPSAHVAVEPTPVVALSPSGIGHVVWDEGTHVGFLKARQVNVVTGSFGPELSIGTTRASASEALAAFADGRSLVAWPSTPTGPLIGRVLAGSSMGQPFRLAGRPRQEAANYVQLVAHGRRAQAVWTYGLFAPGRVTPWLPSKVGLSSRTVTAGGKLGSPASILEPQPTHYLASALASNAAGQTIVTWGLKGRVMVAAGR